MKLWIVAAAYGLWLFGLIEVFYAANGENENALEFAVMAGAIPAGLQFMLLGIDPFGLVAPAKFAIVLVLVVLLSYLGNAEDWTPLIQVCNISFTLTVSIIVAGSPDRTLLNSIATMFTIFSGILLLYIDFTGKYLWGRLMAHGLEPNFWGAMGLAVVIGGIGAKRLPITGFGIAAGLLTIYSASARGSLLATLAALLTALVATALNLRNRRLFTAIAITGVGLFALTLAQPYISGLVDTVSSDVLKLDDPDRGLGSGFTGRTELWGETISVWTRSPLFGVGYHQHEQMIKSVGAHNAYLAMLADTGIIGLLLYVGLLIGAFLSASLIQEAQSRQLILATIVGYAVYGCFEARALNSGNPLSVLFLMCCFYALADRQRRRVAYLNHGLAIASRSGLQNLNAP